MSVCDIDRAVTVVRVVRVVRAPLRRVPPIGSTPQISLTYSLIHSLTDKCVVSELFYYTCFIYPNLIS